MEPRYFNIVEDRRDINLGEIDGTRDTEIEILETGNKGDVLIVINGVETSLENVGSLKLEVPKFDSLDAITKSVKLDIRAYGGNSIYVKSPEQKLDITRVEDVTSERSERANINATIVDEIITKKIRNLSLSASGEYTNTCKNGNLVEVKKVHTLNELYVSWFDTLCLKDIDLIKTKPTIKNCDNIIYDRVSEPLEEELKKYLESKKI